MNNHDERDIIIVDVGIHNHQQDEAVIARESIVNEIKAAIENDPTAPVKRTYDNTVSRIYRQGGGDRPTNVPEFHNIRAQLNRAKSSLLPDIPHNIEDVNIDGDWAETWRGLRHLVALDNDWGITVFGTDEDLELLGNCTEIYVDGTFRTAPFPYNQFFTIHGEINGRVLCCASALISDKTIATYRQVFQVLKRKIREITGHRWRPRRAISDFEQAIITAFETEFPDARLWGCYFHFSQSLWRRIQELGLSAAYRNDRHLKLNLRKVMALGFIPLALVRLNFERLRNSRRTHRLFNRYPGLQEFYNYFRNNYINGNFLPRMWNVYDRAMEFRTNNFVESFHRR